MTEVENQPTNETQDVESTGCRCHRAVWPWGALVAGAALLAIGFGAGWMIGRSGRSAMRGSGSSSSSGRDSGRSEPRSARDSKGNESRSVSDRGSSPKGVAEDFVNAILQRESDKAAQCIDTTDMTTKEVKDLKEALDELGKKINDSKLEADTFFERVQVPPEDTGYTVVNGAKYTGESAIVMVQFKKGADRKSEGMYLQMVKVDDAWKVVGNFKKENVESEPVDVKAVKAGGAEGVTSPLRLKDIDTSDK